MKDANRRLKLKDMPDWLRPLGKATLRRYREAGRAFTETAEGAVSGLQLPRDGLFGVSAKTEKSEKVAPDALNVVLYAAPDTTVYRAVLAAKDAAGLEVCEGALTEDDRINGKALLGMVRQQFKIKAQRAPSRDELDRVLSSLEAVAASSSCPLAGGCADSCLVSSGKGSAESVRQGRVNKDLLRRTDIRRFVDLARIDVELMCIQTKAKGKTRLAIRPNGTSDIPWENKNNRGTDGRALVEKPEGPACEGVNVVFYDYTKLDPKSRQRAIKALNEERAARGEPPVNYSLTYSYDPSPHGRFGGTAKAAEVAGRTAHRRAREALDLGIEADPMGAKSWSVATAFTDAPSLKKAFSGDYRWSLFPDVPLVDGDEHDLRFTDKPAIVALKPKFPGDKRKGAAMASLWSTIQNGSPSFFQMPAAEDRPTLGNSKHGAWLSPAAARTVDPRAPLEQLLEVAPDVALNLKPAKPAKKPNPLLAAASMRPAPKAEK